MSDLEARIAEAIRAHLPNADYEWCANDECFYEFGAEGFHADMNFDEAFANHLREMIAPLIRELEAEALETFGHMYLNPEQDENYNKTARAGRGYYRALIQTRAKRIRSNDV